MKLKLYYSIVAAALLMNSCSKGDSTPTPPPAPIAVDTLTAGWSKAIIAGFNGGGGDIQFMDNSTGYASDISRMFKSTDGGSTWNQVSAFGGASNMDATADGKFFYVNGLTNAIYKSTDGVTVTTSSTLALARDIAFGDNNNGICSTNGGVLSTTNGGATWNTVSPLIDYANNGSISAFMYNSNTAWVVYDRKVLHANGNLASWKIDSVNTSAQSPTIGFVGVYATSASVVYLSSYSGYIYRSTDGGNNFTFLTKLTSSTNSFSDIEFVNAATGYISVGNRIFKTTDGGTNWTMIVSIANTGIIEIDFTDASHGWAICQDGTVLKLN